MIKYPKKINKLPYSEKIKNPKSFYGLNPKIKFCTKCTYSNQKPTSEKEYQHKASTKKNTILFDEDQICAACRILERKENIINYKKKQYINYENCMARVWVKKYGYFQCNRKKKGQCSDFCELHKVSLVQIFQHLQKLFFLGQSQPSKLF